MCHVLIFENFNVVMLCFLSKIEYARAAWRCDVWSTSFPKMASMPLKFREGARSLKIIQEKFNLGIGKEA